ncbi:SDR family NAD(P)-dependent oxidoreductase [Aestuariivirga sp.]|jgi:3-oxoacyl-[acyl-carrier protein] reductase|uniref:SDR family NAD(P)-dependent oxidoreductase n=1 Tax=Aestuariivirga sp. TaxID=2650926 RepID=UPI00378434DA
MSGVARYLLVGASRGIGSAVARHLAARGAELLSVSRSAAVAGRWIAADVATEQGLDAIQSTVGDGPLDALLYLGGVWEEGAFTDSYTFARSSLAETRRVLDVNLVAPIELMRRLAPALSRSANPRALFIGSLSGIPGGATPEVANTASKFGLMGMAEALVPTLSGLGAPIGITVLNPGNIATPEVEADIAEGRFPDQTPIPMIDLLATIDLVLSLSPASRVARIDLAQRDGTN